MANELINILNKSDLEYGGVEGFYQICNDVEYKFNIEDGKEYLLFSFNCSLDNPGDDRYLILKKEGNEWRVTSDSYSGEDMSYDIFEFAETITLEKSIIIDYGKEQCYYNDKILKTYEDVSDLLVSIHELEMQLANFDNDYQKILCAVKTQIEPLTYEVIIPNNKNSYNLAKLLLMDMNINIDRPGYWNIWVKYLFDEYNVMLKNGFTITLPVFMGYSEEGLISLKKSLIDELDEKRNELQKIKAENQISPVKIENFSTPAIEAVQRNGGIEVLLQRIMTEKLDQLDLEGLTKWELDILRNSVYARCGRSFIRQDLQDYFNNQPWYKINPRYSDNLLTEVQKENVTLIYNYQKRKGLL